ncbi:Lysophospholipase L1 [Paenibacillus sp. UNCCL117]|uniref:SGNH/GDSL hydrolase family protein n=1 Tax=unclassified Paenibacillus TaxID=185978 RepID=UPI0008900B47|nr:MULTISPECIES: SGNH/GDSL hydrolase family protein [unclassified Paenibacillus]SDC70379.1 Lysophospholipase L1 [Paenibacillus sp. cl123]SFW24178.1 Lysophospholipase L1 [Paenibacillus sp. UNCCL117]
MRRGGRYLAVGSSSTYNTVTDGSKLYPKIIAERIREQYGAIKYDNIGWSGAKASDASKSLETFGIYNEVDLITINIGANDAYANAPAADVKPHMVRIVKAFKSRNPKAHIILCNPHTLTPAANETRLVAYRTMFGEVASETGIDLCHFEQAWTPAEAAGTNLNADNLHMNDTGHAKVAEILWTVVQTGEWLKKIGK